MTLILPPFLLFGFCGSAPTPWLLILSSANRNNAALIAHEQCHQSQQRRDGTLRFWWRYITNKAWRLAYEVEAYKVWLDVQPLDAGKVGMWLCKNYGFDIELSEAFELLGVRHD
jgi:hypothetical protein